MDYYVTVGDGGSFAVDENGALHCEEAAAEETGQNHPIFNRIMRWLRDGGPSLLAALIFVFLLLGAIVGWETFSVMSSDPFDSPSLWQDGPQHNFPNPDQSKFYKV